MWIAGVPVAAPAVVELATILRHTSADELRERLERAATDDVRVLTLTEEERDVLLVALKEPGEVLAELYAALLAQHLRQKIATLSAILDDALDEGLTDDPSYLDACLNSLRIRRIELEALQRQNAESSD